MQIGLPHCGAVSASGGSEWKEVNNTTCTKQKSLQDPETNSGLKGFNKNGSYRILSRCISGLPHCGAVPSAMRGLTSLFGMGRGEHMYKQKSLPDPETNSGLKRL